MKKKIRFDIIEFIIGIFVIAVLSAVAVPNFMSIQNRSKNEIVKANCNSVQIAVDDYVIQHDGLCPKSVAEIKFLSNGSLLTNPFTNIASEPINGVATLLGQTGYVALDKDSDGSYDSYEITGYGRNDAGQDDVIVRLVNEK